MAVTEERRHGLYSKLEEVIETQHATTVMELLPPVGWADVATKSDLAHLSERLDSKLESMEGRLKVEMAEIKVGMAEMSVRISKDLRAVLITSVTANTAITALIASVARLF